MLLLMGALGVLAAGLALPTVFDDTVEDEETVDDADVTTSMDLFGEGDLAAPATDDPALEYGHDRAEAPLVSSQDESAADGFGASERADGVRIEHAEGRAFITGTENGENIDVPARAIVMGGAGDDIFVLDGATQIGDQAEIVDFDPSEDRLVVVWDDLSGSDAPEVTLGAIEDASHLSQLMVNGVVLAHVANDGSLNPQDIELVPKSVL